MLKQEELDSIKSMDCLCSLYIELEILNNHNCEGTMSKDAMIRYKPITINGEILDYSDFGTKEDINPELAEPYGCGNMKFIPFANVSDEVLIKYNITQEESKKIQEKLDCLSFGKCGWCI